LGGGRTSCPLFVVLLYFIYYGLTLVPRSLGCFDEFGIAILVGLEEQKIETHIEYAACLTLFDSGLKSLPCTGEKLLGFVSRDC
jgi:hypothetical protein